MNARVRFLAMMLVVSFGCAFAASAAHPVPKDRAALTSRDWLPHVLSKIAPLEWWSFASSSSDLRSEDFSSDNQYEQARANTSFPRFCFSLFRPKPQQMASLISAMLAYKGDVNWAMEDDCIGATPAMPAFVAPPSTADEQEKVQAMLYKVAHPDAEFVKQAMLDAPRLAAFLEARLNLAGKPSLDFDPQWLTREGLAASRGQFEDYSEPGSWTVFLARKPQQYRESSKPTSAQDRPLAIGIDDYEKDALFDELSPGWQAFHDKDPVIPAYPLLSRLFDTGADVLYERHEVDALLDDCLQAQRSVKNQDSIRGLDNLIRIARWAQKLKVGIYFGAEGPCRLGTPQ
jgi:hypothetical protein